MSNNLATIRVELIANAQKFKSNVDKSQQSLKKFQTQTTKTTKGNKKLQDAFRNVSGSIAAVQGPLGPVAGRITSIGAIMGRVSVAGLALTGVLLGIGAAFVKLIRAGANFESQQLKIQALLKATGNAAGQTGQDIEAMAVAIGKGTLASVQGARDAAGVLLTFKTISGEAFGRTLELTQDLAAVGFGSMKTAALQLGKALEDPETGLSALRRVGVSFSEQQKEQIKVMAMTGRQAEAQAMILDALEGQVGGAGKGAAGGLAGAFDTLGENITLFFEKAEAGKKIVAALTTVITGLANILDKFIPKEKELPQTIEEVNKAIEKQKMAVELAEEAFENAGKTGQKFSERRKKDAQTELIAEQTLLKLLFEKKAALESVIPTEDKAVKILIKSYDKLIRKKTEDSMVSATVNDVNREALQQELKVRADLISKLGDSKEAMEAINTLLAENRDVFLRNAEVIVEFQNELEQVDKIATGVANEISKVGDTIVDAFLRGKAGALDFKNILRELIISIQKTIIQTLILDQVNKFVKDTIQGIFNPTGPGLEKIDPPISVPLPPTKRAGGGSVQAGTPTMVGERGPELFVPNTGGVVKNNADTKQMVGSGGGVSITQNLNFAVGVTNTVRAEVMNMLPAIQQSTVNAVAEAKQRGGKFSKAFGS